MSMYTISDNFFNYLELFVFSLSLQDKHKQTNTIVYLFLKTDDPGCCHHGSFLEDCLQFV